MENISHEACFSMSGDMFLSCVCVRVHTRMNVSTFKKHQVIDVCVYVCSCVHLKVCVGTC